MVSRRLHQDDRAEHEQCDQHHEDVAPQGTVEAARQPAQRLGEL